MTIKRNMTSKEKLTTGMMMERKMMNKQMTKKRLTNRMKVTTRTMNRG